MSHTIKIAEKQFTGASKAKATEAALNHLSKALEHSMIPSIINMLDYTAVITWCAYDLTYVVTVKANNDPAWNGGHYQYFLTFTEASDYAIFQILENHISDSPDFNPDLDLEFYQNQVCVIWHQPLEYAYTARMGKLVFESVI